MLQYNACDYYVWTSIVLQYFGTLREENIVQTRDGVFEESYSCQINPNMR